MSKRSTKRPPFTLAAEHGLDDSALEAVVGGAAAATQKQTEDAIAASTVAAALTQAEQHAAPAAAAPDAAHAPLDTNHVATDAANLAHAAQPVTAPLASDVAHAQPQNGTPLANTDHNPPAVNLPPVNLIKLPEGPQPQTSPVDAAVPHIALAAQPHAGDVASATQALADAQKVLDAQKDSVQHATTELATDQTHEAYDRMMASHSAGGKHTYFQGLADSAHAQVVADQATLAGETNKLQDAQHKYDVAADAFAKANAAAQAPVTPSVPEQPVVPQLVMPPTSVDRAQPAAPPSATQAVDPTPAQAAPEPAPSAAPPATPAVAATPASDTHAPASAPAAQAHASDAPSATQALAAAQAALDAQKEAVQRATAQLASDQVSEASAQKTVSDRSHGGYSSFLIKQAQQNFSTAHDHVVADQAALDDATAKLQAAQQAYEAAAQAPKQSAPPASVAKDPTPQAPQPAILPVSAAPPVEHATPSAAAPVPPHAADPTPVQAAPAPAPVPSVPNVSAPPSPPPTASTAPHAADPTPAQAAPEPAPSAASPATPAVAATPASDTHAPASTPAAQTHAPEATPPAQTLAAAQTALDAQKEAVQRATAQLASDQVSEARAQKTVSDRSHGGYSASLIRQAQQALNTAHDSVAADHAALDDATAKLHAAQQAYDAAVQAPKQSVPSAPVAKDPAPQAPQPVTLPPSASTPVEHTAPAPSPTAPASPHAADPTPVQTTPAPTPATPTPAPTPAVVATPASDAHVPASTPAAQAHGPDATSAPQTLAAAQAALDAQKDAVQRATTQLTTDQAAQAAAQATVNSGHLAGSRLAAAGHNLEAAHGHVVADQAALDDATAKLQAAQQAYDAAARGQTASAPSAPVAKDLAPQAPQPVTSPVSAAPPPEHTTPAQPAPAPVTPPVSAAPPVNPVAPSPAPAAPAAPHATNPAPAQEAPPPAVTPSPSSGVPDASAHTAPPSSPAPVAHVDPPPAAPAPPPAAHAIVPPAREPEAVPQMQQAPDFVHTISLTPVVKQALPAERLPATGINLDAIQKLQFPDHTFASATGAINQDNTASGAAAAGVGVTAVAGLDNGVTLTVKTGVGVSAQAVIGQNSYQLQAGAAAGAAAQFDFGHGLTLDVAAQAQGSAFLKVGGPSLLSAGVQGSAGLAATIQEQQSFNLGNALSGNASAGISGIVGATGDATFGLTGIKTKGGVGAVIELNQSASIDVGTVLLAETSGVISPGSLAGGAGLGVTVGDGKVNLNFNLSLALGIGGFNAAASVGVDYQTLGNTVGTFLFGGAYDVKPLDPVKYGLDHALAAPPAASADTLDHAQKLATDFLAQKGIALGGVGDPLSALSPADAKQAAAMVVAGQEHMDSSSLDFRQQSHRTVYAQDFINKAYDAIDQHHLTGAAADLQIRAAAIAAEDWLGKQPGVSQAEVAQFRVDRVNVMLQHDQKEMDAAGAAAKPYFQQLFAEHQADAAKAVVDLYVSNGSWHAGISLDQPYAVTEAQDRAASALAKFGGSFPDHGYADHVSSNAGTLLTTAQSLVALQPHPPETSANYGSGLIEGAYAFIRDHNLTGQAAQRQVDAALYVAEQHYIDQHGTAGFNATRESLLNQVIAHDGERLMLAGPGEQVELQHTVAVNQLSAYISHAYAQAGVGAYSRAVQLNDLNEVDASDLAAIHNAQAQFQHTDGPGPQNWQSDASLKSAALEALAEQLSPHAPAKGASQADAMQYAKDLLTATYANIAEHGLSGSEAQSRINAAVYLGKTALHDSMPNASPGDLAVAFSQQAQQHLYLDQVRLGAAGAATQADAQAALVATTMEVQTLASQAIALSDKTFSYDKLDKAEHDGIAQLTAATGNPAAIDKAYATALQGIANVPATPPKDYASAMKAAHDLVEMAYASIETRAASGKPVVNGGAAFLLEAARHTAEKWVMDTNPSALEQAKFDVMAAQQKLQHDQIEFAAATGADRTNLANAVQADMAVLASAPARIAALQATDILLAPHQYWSTQVTTGGGYDPSQGYGVYGNTYDPTNPPAYGHVVANGPRSDAGTAATEVHSLWDKYNALQGKDDYTGQLIVKDILTTSRAVLQNFPHPVEAAVMTTDASGNVKVLQTGLEHTETYAHDLMQSTYAYIEKQHIGPKEAAPYIEAAKAFMDATLKQDYAQPDLVARVHLAIAQAAVDEHQRQLILAPDDASKADLAKQVYQDRLDVARLSSEAYYHDSNWQSATTTPQAAQQGAQAKLEAIDPHNPNAAAIQLDIYKQVLAGQPQPYLQQQGGNTPAEVGVDQVALGKFSSLSAAEKYSAQLLECAFATVDVKGLSGQAAQLQIKAAMAVGEDAVKHATTPLEFAEYRVQEANHILQHTQEKAQLYGSQGGLDQVLQSNQTFLLQALADVYRLDDRVVSAEKTGDDIAVARAKKAVTQELLAG